MRSLAWNLLLLAAAVALGVALHDPTLPRRFFRNPDLAMGEAYMDGRLTIAQDDIRSFITFALRNARGRQVPWPVAAMA